MALNKRIRYCANVYLIILYCTTSYLNNSGSYPDSTKTWLNKLRTNSFRKVLMSVYYNNNINLNDERGELYTGHLGYNTRDGFCFTVVENRTSLNWTLYCTYSIKVGKICVHKLSIINIFNNIMHEHAWPAWKLRWQQTLYKPSATQV